jgi:undecaprenyl diphosphate synthase
VIDDKLNKDNLPQHVALIMDGNRRWAKEKGLPVVAGHTQVVQKRIEELIERAAELKIPYLTLWAFSTENFGRKEELGMYMRLFRWALKRKSNLLIEKGARVQMIGDLSRFPEDIQNDFSGLMERSKENKRITVTFALNYGGRDELLRAFGKLVKELSINKFQLTNNDQYSIEEYLDTLGMPDPDLIIRTSGEQRLSGFMPWQAVYAELYFTKTLMPDFGAEEFDKAVEDYSKRKRRFGKG